MLRNDHHRIRHMLEAARDAVEFTGSRSIGDLVADRALTLGIVKCIEIIGEAASNVSPDTRARLSQLPWKQARQMRNRLIHAYFDIDVTVVWKTVNEDLPSLIEHLDAILVALGPLEPSADTGDNEADGVQ